MEWYWWVLIVAGVAVIAFIKVKVGGAFLAQMQRRKELERKRLEEDY